MVNSRSRPLNAKDFLIIRILKRAMVQALDEDSMPMPVMNWPADPSKPLSPTGSGNQGQSAIPQFLNSQFDETTRIASLRSWLLSQPDIVRRIDAGVKQEFGESSQQLRRRGAFLQMLWGIGGIAFGIVVGSGLTLLHGIGH